MADPLRVAYCVCDGYRASLGYPQEGEPVQAEGIHHGLQVTDPGIEGKVLNCPVGEAATPFVVPDQKVVPGQLFQPVAPHGAAPVEFQMAEPVGSLDQRWPLANGRVGDTNAVSRGAETDLLLDSVNPPSQCCWQD